MGKFSKMKSSNNIATIIGTRPQIIKIDQKLTQTLIWTGQHWDWEMAGQFFKELKLPKPDYSLNYKSGTRSGQMIDGLRKLLKKLKPKLVLVYGDCNTTLSGALAAAYENIPIAHVEAGLRSGNKSMPEEINRILTDHIATFRFCPTIEAVQNLFNEGIREHTYMVGDVMFDAMNQFMPLKKRKSDYILLTIHRQENQNPERLHSILGALKGHKVIFPAHPVIARFFDIKRPPKGFKIIKPVGYKEMLTLISNAKHVVSDSGGVIREAYWMQKPISILRNDFEFNDILKSGYGVLGTDPETITKHINTFTRKGKDQIIPHYGAKEKIRQLLYAY